MSYKHIFDFFKLFVFLTAVLTPYLDCSRYFFFYPMGFLAVKYCLQQQNNKIDFIDDLFTIFAICIFLLFDAFKCSSAFNILLIVYSNIIIINYIIYCCYINIDHDDNEHPINTVNNTTETDNIIVYINELHEYDNDDLDNWTCVICLENYSNDTVLFKCGHYYHKNCIAEWININNSCPICKKTLEKPESVNTNCDHVLNV